MPIDFSPERWITIKDTYRKWWAKDLDRPIFNIALGGVDPGRDEPELPHYNFSAFYGLDTPAEQIIDRWDWNLSGNKWVGDGFPNIWANFGAGVLGAILGAKLLNTIDTDTVWFEPTEEREIADIDFEWDADNVWLNRIAELMQTGQDRWDGQVQMSMTDLGGNLDVLSTFRPSSGLLLDLIDHPNEVKRLTSQEHEMWWKAYDQFNSVLQPRNPGYTAWTPIYSEVPYYILQCDFCYMIGPDMFDEFVKPEMEATCKRLGNAFYHLDGPGELPHLDSLLAMDDLAGIQWVPGAGNPDIDQWPEVYERIRAAGKLVQIWHGKGKDGRYHIDSLSERCGSAEGFVVIGSAPIEEETEVMKMLERYGAA
jgi:hypothetical protein